MKIMIKINLDNAEAVDDYGEPSAAALAYYLRQLAEKVRLMGVADHVVRDGNGNIIGGMIAK